MKQKKILALAFLGLLGLTESPAQNHTNDSLMEKLTLTTEWDKTFPQSDKVSHCKVTFCNRYGITLAADLYKPKGATGPLPLLRRGCLQETEGRQQAAADCAGRQPHRPLRQHEKNPV